MYVCVWERSSRLVTYICIYTPPFLSSVFWVQFPAPSCRTYFLWQKRRCLYTQFYIQSDPPHSSGTAPALSRHSGARSLCGTATEDSVTNGNYICVFFMNPSNTGLLKMLPRYLRLSATSSWDQIGMLLRQSRTTHPLVSPVMCVTACVGEIPCFIQLQMYTLNSCWCARNREVTSPIWSDCMCVHVCVQPFLQNMVF